MMAALLAGVLALAGAVLLVPALYLLALTVSSAPLAAMLPRRRDLRFVVLVPAHDEAEGIAGTVRNLQALDWPAEAFRIVVIADNCTDATAERARAAGAEVLLRDDAVLRGKGHALALGYAHVIAERWADAVVVVDADTQVSANLLVAFAARLEAGAAGVQAFYGVANPLASWRTRLMAIALGAFHRLRGRARERWGVGSILRGNGMAFSVATLRQMPHRAFSLVEDLEYSLQLARAGARIGYADEAEVRGEMVAGAKAAESQRQRWEAGRAAMTRRYGWPLLRQGLRRRQGLLIDLALDILVPPLSQLLALNAGIALATVLFAVWTHEARWLWLPAVLLGSVVFYVLRGAALSGLGAWRVLQTLLMAPTYVVWKLGLRLLRRAPTDWVRTTRETPPPQQGGRGPA